MNYDFTLVCGNCNAPAHMHPIVGANTVECLRDYLDFPRYGTEVNDRSDYYLDSDNNVYLLSDYSGTAAKDYSIRPDDEDEYVSADIELNALDRWYDKEPNLCTVTLEQHLARPDISTAQRNTDGTYVPYKDDFAPETTNVYVEGEDGYLTVQGYDPLLTRRYQARLLNVYHDKQGYLRIGSIRIRRTPNPIPFVGTTVTAECVAGYCKRSMSINTAVATRDEQEFFTYSVIRHGNNHAANWFRSRRINGVQSWYAMHMPDCDLSHHTDTCNHNAPVTKRPTMQDPTNELIMFVIDHTKVCSDSNCACQDWLDLATMDSETFMDFCMGSKSLEVSK